MSDKDSPNLDENEKDMNDDGGFPEDLEPTDHDEPEQSDKRK